MNNQGSSGFNVNDAALIASAPDLAAEVLRLRAENAQLIAANQALVAREAEAREALDRIAKRRDYQLPSAADIARAFLAGKPTP